MILSTADFDSPVWTNKQHLARGLAASRDVYYIESLGLRAPRLRAADIRRALDRLRGRRSSALRHHRPKGLVVLSPLVIPFHGLRAVRTINRLLLRMFVTSRLPKGAVFWTFSPVDYEMGDEFSGLVYHSVDLVHETPGTPRDTLLASERSLIERADAVVASSKVVAEHLAHLGAADVHLWENVAQTELFSAVHREREDRAVFAGNLTPVKVDFDLLLGVLDSGVKLDLAGPISIDGQGLGAAGEKVLAHPNARYRGLLSLDELADLFARARVGLIPYELNRYTDGVFPMKVYEYLSAGLRVVATPLPSLAGLEAKGLETAPREQFGDRVLDAMNDRDVRNAELRSQAAQARSWTHRTAQADELVEALAARAARRPVPGEAGASRRLSRHGRALGKTGES
ncbi:glycosyltransferase [Xylanimonas allomyrinae]|uniref:Glycosyltransferase n=1 Tax=Xylanimonas allomyrinae TaxID=2509459 RepID=A0A4P6EM35_9MICO|nr:glycosyltransferase [Xylanimonas allomyrinae]QAY63346.1 glycosyltransferase [Xylanimonas allomyrinae]